MHLLLVSAIVAAILGWVFALDYRKQNHWLQLKNEGYKSALLAYMMYRYRDLAKIEKLEADAKVCNFARREYNTSGPKCDNCGKYRGGHYNMKYCWGKPNPAADNSEYQPAENR